MEDVYGGGVWLKHHWAPYWYTCGLCGQGLAPDLVLKTETLHLDVPALLKLMKLTDSVEFPDIRTTGVDDDFVEGNNPTDAFVEKYFSILSKVQVLELHELYRLDHLMFNYSPQKYVDFAY